MKKNLIFISLMMFVSTNSLAQLKVNQEGKVTVGANPKSFFAQFEVHRLNELSVNAIETQKALLPANFLMSRVGAIYADNNKTNGDNNESYGIMGSTNSDNTGHYFGVYGCLRGSGNGAAVLGSLDNKILGKAHSFSGQYAGYFEGELYCTNKITATNFYTPSDITLKENVTSMSSEAPSALSNILNMNVVKYHFKPREDELQEASTKDTLQETDAIKVTRQKLHYGLIAQELQTIYPNLVEKGQDGYLSVNYVELIPILIRAIQELKQEVDELSAKATDGTSMSKSISTANIETAMVARQNILYQNTPNPFRERTVIKYQLASDAVNASVCIFDMQGKMLKTIPVSAGTDSVTINGYELGAGMYIYSLLVNGQEVDTKRMIITK